MVTRTDQLKEKGRITRIVYELINVIFEKILTTNCFEHII